MAIWMRRYYGAANRFHHCGKEHKVCRLQKGLYGLKRLPALGISNSMQFSQNGLYADVL